MRHISKTAQLYNHIQLGHIMPCCGLFLRNILYTDLNWILALCASLLSSITHQSIQLFLKELLHYLYDEYFATLIKNVEACAFCFSIFENIQYLYILKTDVL